MSKRLFDTNKWDKLWFRKLKPKHKCFWEFILSKCDISGVWDVDFETAEFYIGEHIDHSECLKLFKDQIYVMNDKKWFILDFFSFQNGSDLNEKSPIHKKIKETLIKHGLWDMDKNTLFHTVYDRVCNTPLVIVKEKVIVEVKVKEPEEPKNEIQLFVLKNCPKVSKLECQLTEIQCETLVNKYGSKNVKDKLEAMENKKDLLKKYSNVYLTVNNWLKKDFPDKETEPSGKVDFLKRHSNGK